MHHDWHRERVLITVRTYPTPAKKGVEVSCTAGITASLKWIRLFPVPYRFVDPDKRFHKYQWIDARVRKASDSRPESHHIDISSIEIVSDVLSSANGWAARGDYVLPLEAHCMCCLQEQREKSGAPTLGIFRPGTIDSLVIEPDTPQWTPEELARLRQVSLWENAPVRELEKIPYKFHYRFRCPHHSCRGHKMMCSDWELGQSYRRWSRKYPLDWEQHLRLRYEREMIELNDTRFYVGTLRGHPASWIVVGLWYPRLAHVLQAPLRLHYGS